MKNWIQISKGILLVYLAWVYTVSNEGIARFLVFFLLYLCLNLGIDLVKSKWLQSSLTFLSILAILYATISLQPLMILLLPLSLLEFGQIWSKDSLLILPAVLPILFLEPEVQLTYGLITAFSILVFQLAKRYTERTTNLEIEADQLRKKTQQLQITIQNLQQYIQQAEALNRLDERNRIAQEIHDRLGHSMTGAFLQMQAARRLIDPEQKQALRLLENAIKISKEGFDQIRTILKNIKPPHQQLGIHRIRLILEEFSTQHGIKTHLHHPNHIDVITPLQWKVIEENTTEALTNILKHASATEVSLTITRLNQLMKVEIRDNGKGIDKIKKGMGIMGMEERISMVDGQLIVDGSNGFSVTMLIPISHEKNMKNLMPKR